MCRTHKTLSGLCVNLTNTDKLSIDQAYETFPDIFGAYEKKDHIQEGQHVYVKQSNCLYKSTVTTYKHWTIRSNGWTGTLCSSGNKSIFSNVNESQPAQRGWHAQAIEWDPTWVSVTSCHVEPVVEPVTITNTELYKSPTSKTRG